MEHLSGFITKLFNNNGGNMKFSFEQQGYVGVLKFYGKLTLNRLSELKEALMVSLNNTDYLVVNFQNVSISNCASLVPVLTARHRAMRQNKSLKVVGVNDKTLQCAAKHYLQYGNAARRV
jgi:anti-anti-sigma factor